jgi:hypothetical protein
MQDPLLLRGVAELGQELQIIPASTPTSFAHIGQLLSARPVRQQSFTSRQKLAPQKSSRGPSRKQVMAGLSANECVRLFKDVPSVVTLLNDLSQATGISQEDLRFEWGHLKPQLAGGANQKANLVAILNTTNSQMMPMELTLRALAAQYPIHYEVKAPLVSFGNQYLSIATATGLQCNLTIRGELKISCNVTSAQPHRRQFPVLEAVSGFYLTGIMPQVRAGSTYFNRMSRGKYAITCRGAEGPAVTAALEPHLELDTTYVNVFECTTPGGRKYSSTRVETPTTLISPGGTTVYKHRSRISFINKSRRSLLPTLDMQNQENQFSDPEHEKSKNFTQGGLRLSFFTPERATPSPIQSKPTQERIASPAPTAGSEDKPRLPLHRRSATQ